MSIIENYAFENGGNSKKKEKKISVVQFVKHTTYVKKMAIHIGI